MYRVSSVGDTLQVRELRGGDVIRSHAHKPAGLITTDHAALWTSYYDSLQLYTDICVTAKHCGNIAPSNYKVSFRVQDNLMQIYDVDFWVYLHPAAQGWCTPTKLYKISSLFGSRLHCRSAVHNGHTYIIPRHYGWESQSRESREFCTILSLPIWLAHNVHIATGSGCLFLIGNDGSQISAFDPRDPADVSVIYDGSTEPYPIMAYFRDVPNGIMLTQPFTATTPRTVELFDQRSCARVGTDIFLGPNEILFCTQLK